MHSSRNNPLWQLTRFKSMSIALDYCWLSWFYSLLICRSPRPGRATEFSNVVQIKMCLEDDLYTCWKSTLKTQHCSVIFMTGSIAVQTCYSSLQFLFSGCRFTLPAKCNKKKNTQMLCEVKVLLIWINLYCVSKLDCVQQVSEQRVYVLRFLYNWKGCN